MATEPNYTLVRLILETIPDYNGDKDLLEIFISACDNFHSKYYSRNNAELNQFIYQAILGKLKGNALLIIASRTELNTWPQIKDELRNVYGERLSLDNLEQVLMTCSLQKNESYQNFAKRLQLVRSKLALKLKTLPSSDMDAASKQIHLRQYDNLALKIFVRHLDRRLRDKIITLKPTNLEQAMALVQEDQNFELFLQPQTSFKQIVPKENVSQKFDIPNIRQKPVHVQSPFPFRPFNSINYQTPPNQFINRSQNPTNSQVFGRPFNPVNYQAPLGQFANRSQYPTNSQVFGRPINVWQPKQNPTQNYQKPTPMSGVVSTPTNIPQNNSSLIRKNPQPYYFNKINELQNTEDNADSPEFNNDDIENIPQYDLATGYSENCYNDNENYDIYNERLYTDNEYLVDDNLQDKQIVSRDFQLPTRHVIKP